MNGRLRCRRHGSQNTGMAERVKPRSREAVRFLARSFTRDYGLVKMDDGRQIQTPAGCPSAGVCSVSFRCSLSSVASDDCGTFVANPCRFAKIKKLASCFFVASVADWSQRKERIGASVGIYEIVKDVFFIRSNVRPASREGAHSNGLADTPKIYHTPQYLALELLHVAPYPTLPVCELFFLDSEQAHNWPRPSLTRLAAAGHFIFNSAFELCPRICNLV
jgi:hypothetical protein